MTAQEMMLQEDQAASLFMTLKPRAYKGPRDAIIFDVFDPTDSADTLTLNTLFAGYGPIVYKTRRAAGSMIQHMTTFGMFLDAMNRDLSDIIEEHAEEPMFDCIYIAGGPDWETIEALPLNEFRDADMEIKR